MEDLYNMQSEAPAFDLTFSGIGEFFSGVGGSIGEFFSGGGDSFSGDDTGFAASASGLLGQNPYTQFAFDDTALAAGAPAYAPQDTAPAIPASTPRIMDTPEEADPTVFSARDPYSASSRVENDAVKLAEIDAKAKNGDPAARDQLQKATGLLGSNTLAAMIQLGGSMLAGSAQARMQEKMQKRNEEIRQEEIARKERNAAPGNMKAMRWGNKGLLGSAVPQ